MKEEKLEKRLAYMTGKCSPLMSTMDNEEVKWEKELGDGLDLER